jgi:hypothetical protein
MTLKEYFLLTKETTKSFVRITSIVFTVVFILLFVAMKIKDVEGTENFSQKFDFDKKYKRSNVELNGYGFLKNINEKEWKRLSVNEIENIIKELILISEMEKFALIKD